MQTMVKKANKSGNSSAVILPKSWVNKEVRVELIEKTPKTMINEILEIMESKIELSDIMGIYLVGSRARGDYEENSDIDVLIITRDTDLETIDSGLYSILTVSFELLIQKLHRDLLPIGPMMLEARTLINSNLLEHFEVKVTKRNTQWYIDSTKDRLKLIKESIDRIKKAKPDGKLEDIIAYSLVLRIRTLLLISNIIKKKKTNKKEFLKLIKKTAGSLHPYERYLVIKNKGVKGRELNIGEAEKLYNYLKKQVSSTSKLITSQNKQPSQKPN